MRPGNHCPTRAGSAGWMIAMPTPMPNVMAKRTGLEWPAPRSAEATAASARPRAAARTELLNHHQHPHALERQHVINAITGRDWGSHPGPRAGKGGRDVKRTARFAAAAAAIVVAGAVGWGTAGAAPGDELLKIGAPVAATGPTAREGVLTK